MAKYILSVFNVYDITSSNNDDQQRYNFHCQHRSNFSEVLFQHQYRIKKRTSNAYQREKKVFKLIS